MKTEIKIRIINIYSKLLIFPKLKNCFLNLKKCCKFASFIKISQHFIK